MTYDEIIEFTPEQVTRIRDRYGFSESFELGEALESIAMFFEKPEYFDAPTPVTEQKNRFDKIRKLTKKLEDEFNGLTKDELLLIGRQHSNWSKFRVIDFIKEQRHMAEGALVDLSAKSGRKGAPRRDTERSLIKRLMYIYKAGTGKDPGYTYLPVTSEYTGNTISFIEDIANHLNAPIKNRFIGDTVKSILSRSKQ
jgi:hypothetical protein